MTVDPIALARQLIDIPSITDSEGEVGEFLERELARLGFQTDRQDIASGRFNLFATTGKHPRVLFSSHLDTVPPWLGSREDGEFVYGRGACDTKGIIAAMIAAGERLQKGGTSEFAFLFVVGEETDSIGAKMANEAFAGRGSEYVIVGEPTESQFARASKGALTCTVRFEGVAAHSAYPERGDSAIAKMVSAIQKINATDWGEHETLGKTTVNVGIVRGGEKPNIVPASAECEMIFRTAGDPAEVLSRLESMVLSHAGCVIRSHGNVPQFMVVPEGRSSVVVAFNSDVPHLRSLGKPLLFGPGSILDAHGSGERIAKQELLAAVDTYHQTVIDLLGESVASDQ